MSAIVLLSLVGPFLLNPAPSQQLPTRLSAGYEVTLLLPVDGLVVGEEMQIEFRVVDRRDPHTPRPVRFAIIQAKGDMPAMPGMPPFEEAAHREGVAGVFGVHPTFGHSGDYLLTLSVQVTGIDAVSPADVDRFQVQFPLSVSDARDPLKSSVRPVVKRFALRVTPPVVAAAGAPVDLTIAVMDNFSPGKLPDGRMIVIPAPIRDFEEQHEKLLHLFLVREDLGEFSHEHPEMVSPGAFRLRFGFPTAGRYRVFADVAPRHAGSQILMTEVTVSGDAPARFDLSKGLAAGTKRMSVIEDLAIEWQWPAPVPSRKSSQVSAVLRMADGRAVTDLQPYLGAVGHLMLLHEDGTTFVHCHPDDRPPADTDSTTIRFLARFPKEGLYRGWGQFQRAGRIFTSDFIVRAGD